MSLEEKTISTKEIFNGRIVSLRIDEVSLPDGNKSYREIVEHPGAVGVVAIDDENCIWMVKQFRKPVEKEMLEIPAGKLDAGEDTVECAKRELEEETGLTANNWDEILYYYTTPGFSSEILYLYMATELTQGEYNPDKDEFLEVLKIPLEEAYSAIFEGKITDGKSIIGIQYAYKKLERG
ncbi:ADP-ribose pyrophosphatase [Candidatus Syntrophocurvum alkaliphilum]|uniref:ADP-ribose pyrophosphatase n=1 Tax=Candidatus Syntrophocurvum alkaliphilum TaxID=2293317 RepID=A0A6I6DC10_9FIRM|nr:NUDIX hydrolase [Candidatus Syntrophocurvum alkaliphilum]QGT98984.1 ADP-ribose pyrophosphatase [Candidatus Syntrophocurvum alkaliphilum]